MFSHLVLLNMYIDTILTSTWHFALTFPNDVIFYPQRLEYYYYTHTMLSKCVCVRERI